MDDILKFRVGSDPAACHLAYDDDAMAPRHLELTIAKNGSLYVQDLASDAGVSTRTFVVDGLEQKPLEKGLVPVTVETKIAIGKTKRHVGQILAELLVASRTETSRQIRSAVPAVRRYQAGLALQRGEDAGLPGVIILKSETGEMTSRANGRLSATPGTGWGEPTPDRSNKTKGRSGKDHGSSRPQEPMETAPASGKKRRGTDGRIR